MLARELEPQWLGDWSPGTSIPADSFMASRVVFYPGSGTDGQPVKFFGSRHLARCFIYVDYGITREHIERELLAHPFAGYRILGRVPASEHDLSPGGWTQHLRGDEVGTPPFPVVRPYALFVVLERDADRDDAHGPRRLCVLFLCADGVAAYDALFCQGDGNRALAVVLQDHGFGGNYTTFGRGGALEMLASRTDSAPQLLLIAENTDPWEGYRPVESEQAEPGGVHGHVRRLWERAG